MNEVHRHSKMQKTKKNTNEKNTNRCFTLKLDMQIFYKKSKVLNKFKINMHYFCWIVFI